MESFTKALSIALVTGPMIGISAITHGKQLTGLLTLVAIIAITVLGYLQIGIIGATVYYLVVNGFTAALYMKD